VTAKETKTYVVDNTTVYPRTIGWDNMGRINLTQNKDQ
jgi:hypothetical protein